MFFRALCGRAGPNHFALRAAPMKSLFFALMQNRCLSCKAFMRFARSAQQQQQPLQTVANSWRLGLGTEGVITNICGDCNIFSISV